MTNLHRCWPDTYGVTADGEPYAVYEPVTADGEPDYVGVGLDPSAQPVDPHDAARDAAWRAKGDER